MAFHVEIRRSLQRARVFNLDEAELRRTVIEPWVRGGPVRLGDREWDPARCRLTVLEGPELVSVDLAMGQGWNTAERSARVVTAQVVREARPEAAPVEAAKFNESSVAVLASTAEGERVASEMLTRLGLHAVEWAPRLMSDAVAVSDRRGPRAGVAAAIIVVETSAVDGAWLFDAGIAVGALGGRAIAVQVGAGAPPPELDGLGVMHLEPGTGASLHALAERLRRAGVAAGSVPR